MANQQSSAMTAASAKSTPSSVSRTLAACAYLLGAFSLVIVAVGPRNPFLLRHAQQAMVLHIVRIFLAISVILTYYAAAGSSDSLQLSTFTIHLGALVLIGVPWPADMPADLVLLLGLPLGGPWVAAICAAMVSALGKSLDVRAALSSTWPEWIDDAPPQIGTPEYDRSIGLRGSFSEIEHTSKHGSEYADVERGIARDLRDQRLERMWSASRVAAKERYRQDILSELEKRQETVLVRLDHLNHLLSGGSISMARYNRFNQELIGYLDSLRGLLTRIRNRRLSGPGGLGELPEAPGALTRSPEAEANSLAVIDRSGIPVVTYGHFEMDESLISGMVSVLEGLSEEMFGSRANMTQLADGEVVYYAQGKHCSAFATFEDEPSPAQVTTLRDFVETFESVNEEQLQRTPFDPNKIERIDVPFRFARRMTHRV